MYKRSLLEWIVIARITTDKEWICRLTFECIGWFIWCCDVISVKIWNNVIDVCLLLYETYENSEKSVKSLFWGINAIICQTHQCVTLFLCPTPIPLFHLQKAVPAGIWCQNDVASTSMRRNHVASTLIRHHFLRHMPVVVSSLNPNECKKFSQGICRISMLRPACAHA